MSIEAFSLPVDNRGGLSSGALVEDGDRVRVEWDLPVGSYDRLLAGLETRQRA